MSVDPVRAVVAHPEALAPFTRVLTAASGAVPFSLWPHQVEVLRAALEHDRVLVLKARQLGVSWVIALLALWWVLAHPGHNVVLISIGEREASDLMGKVRGLYESLPAVVRGAFPLGAATTQRLEVAHRGAPAVVHSLPSSSTAGRGLTIHLLVGDERMAWPRAEEQEASLFPAAADSGRIVLVGTANGMDAIHTRWVKAPANGWHPIFVGALARPGRSDEWVWEQRAALGDKGPQEFPLSADEAFLASGRCAFDRDNLGRLLRLSCAEPLWQGRLKVDGGVISPLEDRSGSWQVWEWPSADREYLVGADVAGGRADGDFSAAAVYDTTSWDQVAGFHGHVEPAVFARELVRAGWLYQGGGRPALVAHESNNHGQAVSALLTGWGYPSVYRTRSFDKRTQRAEMRVGWVTDAKSRNTLIHALSSGVDEGTLGIRDAATIGEMHRFIYRETLRGGRFEADSGAHDDLVMAHGIAAAVLELTRAARPRDLAPLPVVAPRAVNPVTGYAVA